MKDEKNVKVKVIEGAVSKKLGHKNGQKPLKQPARPLRRSARYAGKKKG